MNPPSNWNTPGFWTAAVGVAGILINLLGHTFTPDQQGLVAAWLGHTDVSFTLRTYVHAQPEALLEAAQSLTRSSANTGD